MTRSKYMQELMTSTYSMVATEAIEGGFDGAWERLISYRLKIDCKAEHSEALEIVESLIESPGPKEKPLFLKAAYLITSSKIEEHETTI